jgi:hypothetical protein
MANGSRVFCQLIVREAECGAGIISTAGDLSPLAREIGRVLCLKTWSIYCLDCARFNALCALAPEDMDGSGSGFDSTCHGCVARNKIFLAGIDANFLAIDDQSVRALDYDEILIKVVNVFLSYGVALARPKRHLTAFNAVEYVTFDIGGVLGCRCDTVGRMFHEFREIAHY